MNFFFPFDSPPPTHTHTQFNHVLEEVDRWGKVQAISAEKEAFRDWGKETVLKFNLRMPGWSRDSRKWGWSGAKAERHQNSTCHVWGQRYKVFWGWGWERSQKLGRAQGYSFGSNGRWTGEISRSHALTIGAHIPFFIQHFSSSHSISFSPKDNPSSCPFYAHTKKQGSEKGSIFLKVKVSSLQMTKQMGQKVNNRWIWAKDAWLFSVLFLSLQLFHKFEIISRLKQ